MMAFLTKPLFLLKLLVASLIFLLGTSTSSAATKGPVVEDIRHWSSKDYTRIVVSLSQKAKYTHRLLKKDDAINAPGRLLIDIAKAAPSSRLAKSVPINDGLLKMVRAASFDKDTFRVVLDIESLDDFKVFHLNDPYRIVVDVYGAKKPKEAVAKAEAKETEGRTKAADKKGAVSPAATSEAPPAPIATARVSGVTGKTSLTQELGLKVKTLVIDAGHGGKDPGAVGRGGLKEKDVTLKITKLLKERLSKHVDRIVLTRSTDVFIPLEERTAIANKNDADLFISVHINASPRRAASGIETYILSLSQDEESRRVAARENATSTRSVNDLEFILNDLIRTAKTNDSSRLAASVQDTLLNQVRKNYDRSIKGNGVKGAPFYVLVGTKMPAILVEASFISNPKEEKMLRDEKYINEVADGIASGILKYISNQAPM